jgi:integrase
MQTITKESDAYTNFINSLDSEASRTAYRTIFPYFMKFCKIDTYDAMLLIEPKKLEGLIRDYIIYLREDRKVSSATVAAYSSAIAHFFEMNDVVINWKKLKKFKGKKRAVVEDVPYTRDQIKIMIDLATLRDRCMILVMASAGLRRGALSYLRIKDLERINKYNLYQITVYKKEQEQYTTFCTPEAAKYIDQYLDWRARLGETLKPESPLFRLEYDTTDYIRIAKPRPVRPQTVSHVITTLLDKTGIRPRTQSYHRTSLMACHGFRKFFDTQCINHSMNPIYCEYLMGHKTGLMKSYFKPTCKELLEGNDQSLGYAATISYLTINPTSEENRQLREELQKREQQHTAEWELLREQITEMRQKIGMGLTTSAVKP